MKFINQWSILICLSAMACSIIELILPCGKMEKMLKMVLGVFIIVSLILPFSNGIPKFNIKWKQFEQNTNQTNNFISKLDEQFKSLAENNLKSIIKEILKEKGIKSDKIEIFMDIKQDNCISVNKCCIYIPRTLKKNGTSSSLLTNSEILDIKKELEKRLSIETEVIIEG